MDPRTQIDEYLAGLPGWQRDLASTLRRLIHEADPGIEEAWKWGTPVFARSGNVCAIGVFRDKVKVNFFNGAALADPDGLFNAGLEAKTMRSIDYREGDPIDEGRFRSLVVEAVAVDRKA